MKIWPCILAVVLATASPAMAGALPADDRQEAESRYRRPGLLQRLFTQAGVPRQQATGQPGKSLPPGVATTPAPPTTAVPPAGPATTAAPAEAAADELSPPPASDTLDLDSAKIEATPSPGSAGPSAGPFSNIVLGGTLDYRFLFPKDMRRGMFMIHVNELFVTTNIGNHLSILAEQLLLTSDLGSTVGQDHGFVYVTISNLPVVPEGTAFRIGRLRMRYGIDAKLDAPANPLRTTEYRTIGTLSDRAVEVSGYFGPVEYAAAITQGPDFLLRYPVTADGEVVGPVKTDAMNSSHPVFVRLGTDFKGTTPNCGVSGFYGKAFPVSASDGFQAGDAMLFGGLIDQTRLVLKERLTIDGRWNMWRLKLAAEYTIGRDHDGGAKTVQAWFGRADVAILPQRLTTQLQYDRFDDGRPGSRPVGAPGAAVTLNVTDESWVRLVAQGNERLFAGRGGAWLLGTQLLFAF